MTWGFPCQDVSLNGKMEGIKEGNRSGLYYEGYRILKEKKPKYSVIENVRNLTSKRFKNQFDSILKDIESLGYTNYWKILNAKDFGIPQSRERIFIISIRNDVDKKFFRFPTPTILKLKLKDLLEKNVEEKYYLSKNNIQELIKERPYDFKFENSEEPYILIKENTKKGYVKAEIGDSINYTFPNCKTKRGRVGKQIAHTILTASNMATLIKIGKTALCDDSDKQTNLLSTDGRYIMRIRKLTPLECWRLMGFDDIDFYKIKSIGISDTQAYKQAGNSIVVNVLEKILYELLIKM